MSQVKVIVTIRERYQCTTRCIQRLVETEGDRVEILLFDNASSREWDQLSGLYAQLLAEERICGLICNRPAGMPGVVWSKPWALRQALKLLELMPGEERKFMLLMDNDIEVRDGWLDACLAVLEDPLAETLRVRVVSAFNGSMNPNLEVATLGRQPVFIREEQCGAFWFAPFEYWQRFDPPPCDVRVHDDVYLFRQMQSWGDRIAVLQHKLASTSDFDRYSVRATLVGRFDHRLRRS